MDIRKDVQVWGEGASHHNNPTNIKLTQIQAQHIALRIRMYPIPCVFSSVFISFRVSHSVCIPLVCIPLRIFPTPRVFPSTYVSHSMCFQLGMYPTPCECHFMCPTPCLQLPPCVSHFAFIPLQAYPTQCVSHSVCISFSVPLRLHRNLCIPLCTCKCPTTRVSNSGRAATSIPHSVCIPPCIPPCVFHSACVVSLRVCPTLCVFHTMYFSASVSPTPFVPQSVCVRSVCLSSCESHFGCVPLFVYSYIPLRCIPLLIPLRIPLLYMPHCLKPYASPLLISEIPDVRSTPCVPSPSSGPPKGVW